MSLFSHTIKIQRDTKKSTFAGVVSGSKLNDFRLHSAIELENKSKPPTPDDLNKRRPSQIVAIGGEDALRKRSTKKKAVKASHHELSDGNCGDSEDHNETTPPVKRKTSSQLGLQESISLSVDSVKLKNTKKKAVKPKNDEDGHTGDTESSLARDTRKKMVSAPVASSLDLVESNLHSMETAVDEEHSSHHQKTKHYSISQSHEIVEEKDKLIEEKILVGSPNTSLTDVNQINDSVSVPPVSPCPQAMPSSFAESESGGKEGFFMFRKLRPKSAPTKSSSRRTPVADQPKLQSIESQAAIDESLQTPKPDFIHRLFHHSNDAEDSSTGESGADDHNCGHDDEESVGTPVLSPDSPAMSALSPQIPALPMTALSPLANEVDVEHEETPISPKEHVKSLSRRPKTADPTHRTGSDYHRDPNERPSSLFQNLKHGMISRSSSSARPKSANTDKAYSVDDTDQNMFKNLMMPKSVKKFRKRHKKETEKEYIKKVIGEFCISSSLHHVNVIQTVDLIQDNRHQWCVVMEYMPGGDLYARLQEGIDDLDELNCYFKQLMNGVQYIHNMGVAHRDLKPENLILDAECRILKIADFGVSEVFKTCFEKSSHKTKGVCGSEPYIAPEEWGEGAEFYATKVDVWACGIIYYALLKNSVPWHVAKSSDLHYTEYVRRRNPQYNSGFLPFDRLPEGPRNIIYHVLEPDPAIRWTVENILDDPWLKAREVCGMPELEGLNMVHTHKPPAHK
ncbi:serine/threonine-protein kinase HAL4/sat4 [Rhizoclosmatium sp. JEL0117]|nr:serine/threonine-protein kinase HAL4/sat4 [Rhizoclosmatium sp. JEL0117]